jgi:hypothetical protein
MVRCPEKLMKLRCTGGEVLTEAARKQHCGSKYFKGNRARRLFLIRSVENIYTD